MTAPKHILVPIDFSEASLKALPVAQRMAGEGGRLDVIHVLHELPPGHPAAMWGKLGAEERCENVKAEMRRVLKGLELDHAGVIARVQEGNPARVIVDVAAELGVDQIIIPSHGRHGVPRLVLGSVAEVVVRRAACPVMVLRGAEEPVWPPEVVLVPVDFTERSWQAIEQARELVESPSALQVAHVLADLSHMEPGMFWGTIDTGARVERTVGFIKERLAARGLEEAGVHVFVAVGNAGSHIAHLAEDMGADLVVIGTQGRTGLSRLVLGSVAERAVRLCPCPVLALH